MTEKSRAHYKKQSWCASDKKYLVCINSLPVEGYLLTSPYIHSSEAIVPVTYHIYIGVLGMLAQEMKLKLKTQNEFLRNTAFPYIRSG